MKTTNVLYDRIIDISIISEVIERKKTIGINSKYVFGKNNVFEQGYNNDTIVLYEGTSHKVYDSESKGYKTVKAKGRVHYYTPTTRGNLDKGLTPSGEGLLKEGDIVKIKIDGYVKEIMHVVSFSPSHISTSHERERIDIKCPRSGIKPSVFFSVKLLPGDNCYQALLKIKGFNINTIDIRKWNRMEITAGYANGGTRSFSCPIYSSYVESPSPDKTAVFNGLLVGTSGAGITDSRIKVNMLGGSTTVGEIIQKVANVLGLDNKNYLKGKNEITGEYTGLNAIPISLGLTSTTAENGLSLVSWAREVINKAINTVSGEQFHIIMHVSDKELVTCGMEKEANLDTPILSNAYIVLDTVTSAQFIGPSLQVIAPWYPGLTPGKLFKMSPNFIDGSKLPNMLEESQFTNALGLYRCLTVDINFSTVGTENNMKILAIPSQYISEWDVIQGGEITKAYGTDLTPVDYIKLQGDWKEVPEQIITLGGENNYSYEKVLSVESEVSETGNMYSINLIGTVKGVAYTEYVIKEGDTLSYIAETFYRDLVIDITDLEDREQLPEGAYVGEIPHNSLWPLIAVATKNMRTKQPNGGWNDWEENDTIHAGFKLNIPIIKTMEDLQKFAVVRNIFKYAIDKFKDISTHQAWRRNWSHLIPYLGGPYEKL